MFIKHLEFPYFTMPCLDCSYIPAFVAYATYRSERQSWDLKKNLLKIFKFQSFLSRVYASILTSVAAQLFKQSVEIV